MNTTQNGKGSKPRPYKVREFSENWELINWNHKKKDTNYDRRKNESGIREESTGSSKSGTGE
jgi:hypothetical protein